MSDSPSSGEPASPQAAGLETFRYDDGLPRMFLMATLVWGVVGMLVGLIVAIQLVAPSLGGLHEWLTFGRLRPLHTNAVIFAFAGNAFFCGAYYSMQRLLKTRMYSDALGKFHFWGWQAIIVSAAVTLPLGFTQGKEYAELEWPIDIAITLVWVVFALNVFGTIARRRERHIYVAIWFYIASIVTVAVLHIFNNLSIPAGALKSYPIYAGVQDAFMQWWYGHNAVAFFLTTPFLGLMYYFLPKAANRPVFSYKLSILHFWSLVFIYIWAGPHHLHYTALPEWASTLGMLFSVMLWMPSWGGMINGLLTLRGAWNKVASDPVLKFFVVGVTFYGMSTFEGPMLSVKTVNALSHYTDWTIAHVHGGALGWVGFITFGMAYWLIPRLFQTRLASPKLAEAHFWMGTIGILFYIVPIYVAGLTQGLMWRAFDATGRLAYPDFVETVNALMPMYWVRVVGGVLYLTGAILCLGNAVVTWARRPERYEEPVYEAPALGPYEPSSAESPWGSKRGDGGAFFDLRRFAALRWHRRWEALPLTFTAWVVVAVVVASLFEIIPTFLIRSNVPTIASVKPYRPLELLGRDIYIAEGCYNCHSQMVRPLIAETERYGEYSKPGEFVYDHPFQWGSRRIGPDLHRVGGKYPHLWHLQHMEEPSKVTKGSIMPPYPHLLRDPIDWSAAQKRVEVMAMLGVPYGDTVRHAEEDARAQAADIARALGEQIHPNDPAKQAAAAERYKDKQITALIAYLQRLGTDIKAEQAQKK
ncbi:MAG: cytochrome-c oxidase, cbb3-type subunit I [Planctomycetota bacterium]|nr:MAG: cytochrome-c oxidase, cbb3-type subunit I [Planctomycetota bacterium]